MEDSVQQVGVSTCHNYETAGVLESADLARERPPLGQNVSCWSGESKHPRRPQPLPLHGLDRDAGTSSSPDPEITGIQMSSKVQNKKHIAPDGGWGWVIVLSYAFNNVINIPILQGFGLLFRNAFSDLEMSATDISTIINVNSAFGMMLGLLNGPLLREFGFRKICIFGSILSFIGFSLTSTAKSFSEFIIYYGIIHSTGFVLSMASFSLALNSYFVKRRSRASGLCMTITGLGPVFMPHVISHFIKMFSVQGTALILSALGLHSLCGAMLLQPVKWHYRTQEDPGNEKEELEILKPEGEDKTEGTEEPEIDIDNIENHTVHELEPSLVPRRFSDAGSLGKAFGRRYLARSLSSLSNKNDRIVEPEPAWWSNKSTSVQHNLDKVPENGSLRVSSYHSEVQITKSVKWYMKVVKFFDLDLLRDPIYRNIWIGMSLAFSAEINFSLMTPIIMGDRNLDIQQTATIMSAIAVADIIFRFLAPFIGDRLNVAPRYMYVNSLVVLIVFRTGIALVKSYHATLLMCVGVGVAKGFRTVYWTLVIPNQVPLEKLASASGLQTVLNGLLLMIIGPVFGFVRDVTGDYSSCIHLINCLTLSTIILWTSEFLYLRHKAHKAQDNTRINENGNIT